MSSPLLANDHFSLVYDAAARVLQACWPEPLTDAELQTTLLALLPTAQAHGNCRFWLLDVRQRPIASPMLRQWVRQVLHPRLSRGLNGPVFVAFVVAPGQRPAIEDPAMDLHLRAAAADSIYLYYFESEAAALDWLRNQQERDRSHG